MNTRGISLRPIFAFTKQRSLLFSALLISLCVLPGCATTHHEDTAATTSEDKEWEDMTTAQKVGECLWWPLQWGIYYGGSSLGSK